MGLNLYSLIKAGLLASNGLAILHETRFLDNYGLTEVGGGAMGSMGSSLSVSGAKQWIASVCYTARALRKPLIVLNFLAIVLELLFG